MAGIRVLADLVGTGLARLDFASTAREMTDRIRAGERFPTITAGPAFVTLNVDRIEAALRWPK